MNDKIKNLEWYKFDGSRITNINDYVLDYVRNVDNGAKIMVGCDSNNHSRKTSYAISIIFYNEKIRNGAHVVFARHNLPKIKDVELNYGMKLYLFTKLQNH